MILAPLLKLPKNVGDLGKFIFAKGFKSCPKCKKSPNLVTLIVTDKRTDVLPFMLNVLCLTNFK